MLKNCTLLVDVVESILNNVSSKLPPLDLTLSNDLTWFEIRFGSTKISNPFKKLETALFKLLTDAKE